MTKQGVITVSVHDEARIDVEQVAQVDSGALSVARAMEIAAVFPDEILFSDLLPLPAGEVPVPDKVWTLTATEEYRGKKASGKAAVYYGAGHKTVVNALILAQGFDLGPNELWTRLNEPYGNNKRRLLDQLLAAGLDIVLLDFDDPHTYIQANAGVVVSCIRQAIKERLGNAPLIVGGVSMGGMVTRYALATMEHHGEDHQTATYLSYDTPHNGVWVPLTIQQLVYSLEFLPGLPAELATLLNSPAAQQLLWGWVAAANYSGPVATASPLRGEFLDDLRRVGWFPSRPRKLGVANGADGIRRNVTPGVLAFDWKRGNAGGAVHIQPDCGDKQYVGEMHVTPGEINVTRWSAKSYTSGILPFDGAPGSTIPWYDVFARVLGAPDYPKDEYKNACLVPSVSAVALKYDPVTWPINPYQKIFDHADGSDLDDFQCNNENSTHTQVTEVLATWILKRVTK
jgi:hypothetical protein